MFSQYSDRSEIEDARLMGFAYCLSALTAFELDHDRDAIDLYRRALVLYGMHKLFDDQYARAKNRYAQFLTVDNQTIEAAKVFEELEKYWSQRQDPANIYSSRFYLSYAEFLEANNAINLPDILDKYTKAYEILRRTEKDSPFTKKIEKKVADVQDKICKKNFDIALAGIVKQLSALPFAMREIFIESFSTLFLRGFCAHVWYDSTAACSG